MNLTEGDRFIFRSREYVFKQIGYGARDGWVLAIAADADLKSKWGVPMFWIPANQIEKVL